LYDLTVVGGGPAGATCARLAAEAGLDVVLLEKAQHPREKPCGGALGPQVSKSLDIDVSPVVERTFNAARVHTPSRSTVILTSKELRGHIVTRSVFDAYLLQKAEAAGVEVIQGAEVVGVEQLRAGIRALAVGDSYKSQLLVGADGVNSIIARELAIRDKWALDKIALCFYANVPMETSDVESILVKSETNGLPCIELYFDLMSWGYGWCFPKREGLNIGIGCRMDKQVNLKQEWEKFVTRLQEEKRIKLDVRKKTSCRVPLGGRVLRCTSRRSMLIGDAAGLVSPLTGEGISYAIQSGKLAAKIASEAVKKKSPIHVVEYENQLKKSIGQELADIRWISELLHKSSNNKDLLFQIAAEDPIMMKYMTDLVSRVTAFSEVRSKVVKRMLTRHPLKSIRLGLRM
jgi:geranylgeranyl reductase family protein